uniref:Uncharacterized protein n=1 Tax=Romanomermis culicivorax TaxID=13658 RepID=A0A915KZP7_ROMCU
MLIHFLTTNKYIQQLCKDWRKIKVENCRNLWSKHCSKDIDVFHSSPQSLLWGQICLGASKNRLGVNQNQA